MKKIFTFFSLLALCSATANAQLIVTDDTNTVQLVNNFILTGVTAFNVNYTGAVGSLGTFSNGNVTNIGLNDGIIMTTGILDTMYIGGPSSNFSSLDNQSPGCAILDSIIASPTYNASVLEFDLVPVGNVLEFQYVFASEEYSEYVNSSFNDVFGFFINGPDPSGGTYTNINIALVPSTSLPVAINNVNNGYSTGCSTGPCTNCAYFVDNCNGTSIVFDGFTTVLTAQIMVVPADTYHLKMAIADVSDGIYDSGIFLKAQSMKSYPTTGIKDAAQEYENIIYPNPAEDIITLISTKNSIIEIVNAEGQLMKSINAVDKNTRIDISAFSKGIYFVRIISDKDISFHKFIKG